MRTNRIVTRVACLTASLLITSCVPFHQTTTLSSTEFFDRAESGKQRSFADAYLYGEAVKDNYARLKRRQENFRRDSAVAIIAAGATTLFYTVTGGASRDVLTGTAIGGAGLYLTADVLTDRLEQEVFQLGYEGVNCVLSDYARLYDADAALASYLPIGTESERGLIEEARDNVSLLLEEWGAPREAARFAVDQISSRSVTAIRNARISVALNGRSIINRIDGIQDQVEKQRSKIGSDPLTAARNPFQLVLNRANQFSSTPITVPKAAEEDASRAAIDTLTTVKLGSKIEVLNDTPTPPPELATKIAHLQAVIAEAVSVLSVLEEIIKKGPGETACNIPDQSGHLVLKTAPAALTVPAADPATYQIVITDPRIQAVQASWSGKTPNHIDIAPVSGTYQQPTAVNLTVGDTAPEAGTYKLYIVDVSGRFATTVDITVTQ